MTSTAAPMGGTDRITSLDILRGVALFGILIMNINGMGLPMAYGNPHAWGGSSGWDLTTWTTVNILFESSMRTIFSALFGAGALLFMARLSDKLPGNQAADIYMRRNVLLVFFGAAHAYLLLWHGDILYHYGLASLFLFVQRNWPIKKLLILLGVLIAFMGAKNYYSYTNTQEAFDAYTNATAAQKKGEELTKEQKSAITTWTNKLTGTDRQQKRANEIIEKRHQGWWDNVVHFKGRISFFESTLSYTFLFWDAWIGMLLGMVLYKTGMFTMKWSTGGYAMMAILGYGIAVPLRYFLTMNIVDSGWSPLAFDQFNLFLDVSRILLALGHISLLALFIRSGIFSGLQKALAAVGKMALTNYISHSVVALFLFTGAGFQLFGQLSRHELIYVWAAIVVVQLILSPLWLAFYRYGPLEWLWRWMTYGSRPAFRK